MKQQIHKQPLLWELLWWLCNSGCKSFHICARICSFELPWGLISGRELFVYSLRRGRIWGPVAGNGLSGSPQLACDKVRNSIQCKLFFITPYEAWHFLLDFLLSPFINSKINTSLDVDIWLWFHMVAELLKSFYKAKPLEPWMCLWLGRDSHNRLHQHLPENVWKICFFSEADRLWCGRLGVEPEYLVFFNKLFKWLWRAARFRNQWVNTTTRDLHSDLFWPWFKICSIIFRAQLTNHCIALTFLTYITFPEVFTF